LYEILEETFEKEGWFGGDKGWSDGILVGERFGTGMTVGSKNSRGDSLKPPPGEDLH
jgi:hypothetical protein